MMQCCCCASEGTTAVSGWFKDFILLTSCVGNKLQWVSCKEVFKSSPWSELCKRFVVIPSAKGCENARHLQHQMQGLWGSGGSVGLKYGLEFDYLLKVSRLHVVKVLSVCFWNTDLSASVTRCHLQKVALHIYLHLCYVAKITWM